MTQAPDHSKNAPKLITFGCRLNTYESEVMRAHAQAGGLENTIIINTCAVTNEAERQARQAIRKAKRENPEAFIIVTGCSVQVNPQTYADMPEVDRILGNHEKMLAQSFSPDLPTRLHVNDIMDIKETAHHLISGFENKGRAFIQIQNGCNHRCTFCIIPYGRGNNRSVPIAEISNQVKTLVEKGFQEIVFTGVDITDYGGDLPGKPSLGQMARRVLKQNPGLSRLRLSSLDPVEVDEEVFQLLKEEPRLMPHLHISLQAGDNMILKRMKRRHLRDDVIKFCEKARTQRPDVVFGADIIAGFPTETDAMFNNSVKIVEECDITYLHVFPYSAKKGTPASRMPQVAQAIIKERAAQLRHLGQMQLAKFLKTRIGKTETLLLENDLKGHTDHYAPAELISSSDIKAKTGDVIKVKVIQADDQKLTVSF
jgi:threonylcarbamoyladenosine tRNA methylthiotransferase MtaB